MSLDTGLIYFGGGVGGVCVCVLYEAIGLENRDCVKTNTDIRTQVLLGFLSGMDSFFTTENVHRVNIYYHP